jgi:hypothetical protein
VIKVKKIAIIQPNFIPWWGYFKFISDVNEFVFLDDVQYTKRDWRNRNRIRTPNGWNWLSLPIDLSDGSRISINKILLSSNIDVKSETLHNLKKYYGKSEYFSEISDLIGESFDISERSLSTLNIEIIKRINLYLKISTPVSLSSSFDLNSTSTQRLVDITKKMKCDIYYSGQNAKPYLNEQLFVDQGMVVKWYEYGKQKIYSQLYPGFIENLSIVDALFNLGPSTRETFLSK